MADDFGPILPAPVADTFVFDFTAQIAGGTIISATWSVTVAPTSSVLDPSSSSRILSAPTFSGTQTSALLGNMVAGCSYVIAATVTISDGRVLTESAGLQCTFAEVLRPGRTVGALLYEARGLLNDLVPISGSPRFTDGDLLEIFNEALLQVRSKRPDAWLTFGLRKPIPVYTTVDVFPIEDQFYSPLLYYVVGRAELVEDTFADNGRAITLLGKFNTLLLKNNG